MTKPYVSYSEATTRGVRVQVQAAYLEDRSHPDENQYLFAYQVRISNGGETTVQLVSRHWIITDGNGKVEEVKGPGVVGEQPILAPGESFEYTSGCPLSTPTGTMRGAYQIVTSDGRKFEAEIAPFALSEPHSTN